MFAMVVTSPVANRMSPSFLRTGFLSFLSFSSSSSWIPMEYASHCESAEKAGVSANDAVWFLPPARPETRGSEFPLNRWRQEASHLPSADTEETPTVSHLPHSDCGTGALVCA